MPVRTPGGFAAVLHARSARDGVPVVVAIQWNGRDVGTMTLGDAWAEHAFTVPAEAVTSRLDWQTLALAVVFSIALLALTRRFWRFGLRRYSGASA